MNIAVAIFADFAESMLGGPAALEQPIAGRAIIDHTLRRAARVGEAAARHLVVRPRDEAAARRAIERAGVADRVSVAAIDDGARPRRVLLRCARKWALDAWRGSPLGTTWFDEFVEPMAVARVLDHGGYEGVLCLDGCMPALDAGIADAMIRHQRDNADEAKFVFTQAPPGVAGVILRREITRELLEQQAILGHLLSYRPDAPRMDLITRAPCCRVDSAIAQTAARLCGDTRHSRALLEHAFAACGTDADASAICAAVRAAMDANASGAPLAVSPLPREVEIELTTRDPLPDTMLRPRGSRVPHRELDDLDALRRVADELAAEFDDAQIVFGGFGDPLLHPRFGEACRIVREAGICGLAVTTPAVELSDEALTALFDQRVDVVEVLLDAHSADTYRRLHGRDAFDAVIANLERIKEGRKARTSPQPLVIPSITRCSPTLAEIEPFFDEWTFRTGTAVIRGYNDYCGTLGSDNLLPMYPSRRVPCRRLGRRAMLLADGTMVACSQDACGRETLGDWGRQSLGELWRSERLEHLREAHRRNLIAGLALCGRCHEWAVD